MRFEQDDETRQGYISERAKQIAKFAPRPPLSPIPPVGGGDSPSGGSWWKAILGFSLVIIVLVSCVVIMRSGDDSKESEQSVSLSATRRARASATQTAVAPTPRKPTATPWTNKYQATVSPAQKLRPTPTPDGEERWNVLLEHRDNIIAFIERQDAIIADGVIDASESLYICNNKTRWQDELMAARGYAINYRNGHYGSADVLVAYSNLEMMEAMERTAMIGIEALAQLDCP